MLLIRTMSIAYKINQTRINIMIYFLTVHYRFRKMKEFLHNTTFGLFLVSSWFQTKNFNVGQFVCEPRLKYFEFRPKRKMLREIFVVLYQKHYLTRSMNKPSTNIFYILVYFCKYYSIFWNKEVFVLTNDSLPH